MYDEDCYDEGVCLDEICENARLLVLLGSIIVVKAATCRRRDIGQYVDINGVTGLLSGVVVVLMPWVLSGVSSVLLGLPAIEMLVEKGVWGGQRRMKISVV